MIGRSLGRREINRRSSPAGSNRPSQKGSKRMMTSISPNIQPSAAEAARSPHVPSAIIAENEVALREELRRQLATLWPELRIVADAGSGTEALQLIELHQPDVLFLDIQMPGLTGLDVARQAQGRCHVIFVTAEDTHATAAFDVGALDYVLKPIVASRLLLAIARIKQALDLRAHHLDVLMRELAFKFIQPRRYLRWINAAAGDSVRLIAVEDVQYFRTEGKYTVLVTANSESLIRKTLRELNAELDPAIFWQIHRSTIVNTNAIQKIHRSCKGKMDLRLKHRMETLIVSAAHSHLFKVM
jgi:DNA-binding LytR/AlgR family response regulator